MKPLRFDLASAQYAADKYGFNCGPAALCAIAGLTPSEVRRHLGDFEAKGYTNPTMMCAALRSLGLRWRSLPAVEVYRDDAWPKWGLCRVQWEGPWTQPGVPIAARYRKTHWIGAAKEPDLRIFDVNAMCDGGWIGYETWKNKLVPWLLKECQPKATGGWHLTHVLEIVGQ